MSKFCSLPFKRMEILSNGEARTCCSDWTEVPISIGNVFEKDFDSVWNSENAKNIRESVLNGSFRFCSKERCSRYINGTLTHEYKIYKQNEVVAKKSTHLKSGPEIIAMNYDPSCNLYCKTCREKIKIIDKEKQSNLIRFQNNFIKSKHFVDTKRLIITGVGEPFASKVYMDLLSNMTQEEHPNLKISLRTNGTLLNSRNWQSIRNSHYAIDRIWLSIDAAKKKTYHKLRRGGDFGKLKKNLKFIRELKKKESIEVVLFFVVQKENYREIPAFVKMAKRYNFDKVSFRKLFYKPFFTQSEYSEMSVHHPDHREFVRLKKILKKIANDPIVTLGNLSDLTDRAF